jgi:hypothetical protein
LIWSTFSSSKKIEFCLFIDESMKRDHVLITSLNLWTLNHFIVDLSSFISFRKSYLFHSLNLGACSSLIEWDRIDIVERWIDTDQSLHLDIDQKTIRQSAKNELWLMIYSFESHRSSLLVIESEIIFRDFSYIWLRFLPLSVYSRCLQLESELNSNDLFFWTSFQSNSCRLAVKALSISASHQILAKYFASR